MSMVWKVAVGLVVALMLPVAAYAAGSITAPNEDPAPRRDIVVDSPPPVKASDDATGLSKAERAARDRRRDRRDQKRDAGDNRDDVMVVTPQPTPVNDGNANAEDDGDDGDDGDDDDDGDD